MNHEATIDLQESTTSKQDGALIRSPFLLGTFALASYVLLAWLTQTLIARDVISALGLQSDKPFVVTLYGTVFGNAVGAGMVFILVWGALLLGVRYLLRRPTNARTVWGVVGVAYLPLLLHAVGLCAAAFTAPDSRQPMALTQDPGVLIDHWLTQGRIGMLSTWLPVFQVMAGIAGAEALHRETRASRLGSFGLFGLIGLVDYVLSKLLL
jgi:hypothetical protein